MSKPFRLWGNAYLKDKFIHIFLLVKEWKSLYSMGLIPYIGRQHVVSGLEDLFHNLRILTILIKVVTTSLCLHQTILICNLTFSIKLSGNHIFLLPSKCCQFGLLKRWNLSYWIWECFCFCKVCGSLQQMVFSRWHGKQLSFSLARFWKL